MGCAGLPHLITRLPVKQELYVEVSEGNHLFTRLPVKMIDLKNFRPDPVDRAPAVRSLVN